MKNIFKKHQAIFIGITVTFIMIGVAYLFGFSTLNFPDHQSTISALNTWLNKHKLIIILWHVLLLVAIYWGWGIKVDSLVKQQKQRQIDHATIDKYKRFRWVLIITVLIIDLIIYM